MMDERGFWAQLHDMANTIARQGGPSDFLTKCIERDFKKLTPEAQREAQQAIEVVSTALMVVRATLHVQTAVERVAAGEPRKAERKAS